MRSSRQKREQAKQFKRLTEAQAVLGWGVILLLSTLLGVIYLSQASSIATIGLRVQNFQEDLEFMKRENSALERQIAEAQSLERLQQESLRLGFIQARSDQIEYIVVPDYPVMSEPVELSVTPSVSVPPVETIGDVLWLSLRNSISNMIYGEASEQ